jgi:hypothetical protein
VTTQVEVEHKVQQLDNDMQSIYGTLVAIKKTLEEQSRCIDDLGGSKGKPIDGSFHIKRIYQMAQFASEDLDAIKATQERHDNRFVEINTKLTESRTKLDRIAERLRTRWVHRLFRVRPRDP